MAGRGRGPYGHKTPNLRLAGLNSNPNLNFKPMPAASIWPAVFLRENNRYPVKFKSKFKFKLATCPARHKTRAGLKAENLVLS